MPGQFFLWLILNTLLATAAQQNNTFSRICSGLSKWHGTVTRVLNHTLLMNFLWHRRLSNKYSQVVKNMYSVNAGDKSTVTGLHKFARSERCQVEFHDTHYSGQPTAVTWALHQHADENNLNNTWITTRNHKTERSESKGSASNITDALGYSKVCAHVGFRKLNYYKTVPKEVLSFVLLL